MVGEAVREADKSQGPGLRAQSPGHIGFLQTGPPGPVSAIDPMGSETQQSPEGPGGLPLTLGCSGSSPQLPTCHPSVTGFLQGWAGRVGWGGGWAVLLEGKGQAEGQVMVGPWRAFGLNLAS